jgi:carbon monoxide dehydrogenase subunit G
MNMTGERFIAASREAVYAALNDPEVLKACIPGCDSMEKLSDTEMTAKAGIKLGPVSAKFSGKITLSDLDPPNGYKISGEGAGGPAGFAKGGAEVRLVEQEGGALLTYSVDAQVGGKIAQVGGRLIDATAKSMAEQFFKKFAAAVEGPAAPVKAPVETVTAPAVEAPAATVQAEPAAATTAAAQPGFFTRLWRSIVGLFSGKLTS